MFIKYEAHPATVRLHRVVLHDPFTMRQSLSGGI
jgi:hypothetical protein